MGELCGKDYSELYCLVEAQVGDDDFAFFDLAKARATATSEVLVYEMEYNEPTMHAALQWRTQGV